MSGAGRWPGRRWAPALLAVLATAAASCSSGGCAGAASRDEGLTALFEAEGSRTAQERAPDLHAQAERARRDAEEARAAGDPDAADDHATRARLLLAAAVAESERLAMEERRLAVEAETEEALEQARRDELAADEVSREVARVLAARLATEEAQRAFERAAQDEVRRYRNAGSEREQMHREAAAVLTRRARLLLSAARAMGAPEEALAAAQTRIDAVEQARRGEDAMAAADEALRAASAALGAARAGQDQPGVDQRDALVEAAREAGFEAEQLQAGLSVSASSLFAGNATRPNEARIAALAALIQAHPHGPVRVVVTAPRRVLAARSQSAVDALAAAGVPRDRLGDESVEGAPRVDVIFVAYAP